MTSGAPEGKGHGHIAVSCGVAQCLETRRTAMAVGADHAILPAGHEELQPLAMAKLLKALVDKEQSRLIILAIRRPWAR